MNAGIAVFLKTPGRSPPKTRLAAGIGRPAAETWYLRAADAVVEVALSSPGLELHLALAEADADAAGFWLTRYPGLDADAILAQGEGGLGERMACVHAALLERHAAGILVGADAPQLTPADLAEARAWLAAATPRLCLGPATDGGFWLIGANFALPFAAWTAPRYSTTHAADDLRQALGDAVPLQTLRSLTDVDEAADLRGCAQALHALHPILPAQSRLLSWMHEKLPLPA